MPRRKSVPSKIATKILLQCRRRCCLCFYLHGDGDVKEGQIAHIDGDPANNKESNLVFLCLNHHNEYDTRPSQSKRITAVEVGHYRDELLSAIDSVIMGQSTGNAEQVVIQGQEVPVTIERPKLDITIEKGVEVRSRTVRSKNMKKRIVI